MLLFSGGSSRLTRHLGGAGDRCHSLRRARKKSACDRTLSLSLSDCAQTPGHGPVTWVGPETQVLSCRKHTWNTRANPREVIKTLRSSPEEVLQEERNAGAASTRLLRRTWNNRPGARVPLGKCVRDAADHSLRRCSPQHDCGSLARGFFLIPDTAPIVARQEAKGIFRESAGFWWLVNKSFSVTQNASLCC